MCCVHKVSRLYLLCAGNCCCYCCCEGKCEGAGEGKGKGKGEGRGARVQCSVSEKCHQAGRQAYPVVSYAPRPMLKSSVVVLRIMELVCLATKKQSATVGQRLDFIYRRWISTAAWHKGLTWLARERERDRER